MKNKIFHYVRENGLIAIICIGVSILVSAFISTVLDDYETQERCEAQVYSYTNSPDLNAPWVFEGGKTIYSFHDEETGEEWILVSDYGIFKLPGHPIK